LIAVEMPLAVLTVVPALVLSFMGMQTIDATEAHDATEAKNATEAEDATKGATGGATRGATRGATGGATRGATREDTGKDTEGNVKACAPTTELSAHKENTDIKTIMEELRSRHTFHIIDSEDSTKTYDLEWVESNWDSKFPDVQGWDTHKGKLHLQCDTFLDTNREYLLAQQYHVEDYKSARLRVMTHEQYMKVIQHDLATVRLESILRPRDEIPHDAAWNFDIEDGYDQIGVTYSDAEITNIMSGVKDPGHVFYYCRPGNTQQSFHRTFRVTNKPNDCKEITDTNTSTVTGPTDGALTAVKTPVKLAQVSTGGVFIEGTFSKLDDTYPSIFPDGFLTVFGVFLQENGEQTTLQGEECVACFQSFDSKHVTPAEQAFKCNHSVLCATCQESILSLPDSESHKCPMCRSGPMRSTKRRNIEGAD
jgi:hypothetical protein